MATTIALAKATDMATVTEMKRGQGQWQRETNVDSDGNGNSHKDGILDGDCEGDSTLNGYGEGGGGKDGKKILVT